MMSIAQTVVILSVASVVFLFGELFVAVQRADAASAPVITQLADVYLNEGQTVSVTLRATDVDGDSIFLAAIQRPIGSSFTDNGNGTGSFSWNPEYIGPFSSTGSPYIVMFSAFDGTSQSFQTIKIHVQNVNRAPIVSVPESVSVEVGDTITIQPTVYDPDQDRITWSAPGSPEGAVLRNSGGPVSVELTWAPAKSDSGSHTITLMATDEWGLSASASSTVLVSIGATYTVSIGVDTVFPGELVSLSISLKNREPISGFEIELQYDPSVMSFVSAHNGSARTSSFELFTFLNGSPAPGNLKINAVADVPNTSASEPLSPGDGPLFLLNFLVSSENNLAGLFLPVRFEFGPLESPVGNTLTDTAGGVIVSDAIVFINGGVKIEDQSAITRGDINLNGIPFEVADALRFTNYFIDPVNFSFNAQQFANSDINADGIVASIADLVTLLSIVLGDGTGTSRVTPGGVAPVTVTVERNETQTMIYFASSSGVLSADGVPVGAALLTFVIQSEGIAQTLRIDEDALPEGFEAKLHQNADTVRVLIYDAAPNGSLRELSEVRFYFANSHLAINQFGHAEPQLMAVELASPRGEILQASYLKAESSVLPKTFDLAQNYPNPFNPDTEIHYTLSTRANIKLVIYDILGRSVKTLAQGTVESGEYVARWDGVDGHGSAVASGIYFYRLTANGHALSRKMTLLK